MIGRRIFVLAGSALAYPALLPSAWAAVALPQPGADLPVPASGGFGFRIMRKGDVIGTHTLSFSQKGRTDQPAPTDQKPPAAAMLGKASPTAKPSPPLGPLTVHSVIDIVVRLGPVPLYRFNQNTLETWDGDTLNGFSTTTNDNGTRKQVLALRDKGQLMVEAGKLRYAAPPDALGNTYWNPRTLKAPLIGLDEGRLLRPQVADQGAANVQRADGSDIAAEHYALSGDLAVDLWYAKAPPTAPHWVGLALTGSDGSRITYEML